jgi:hypothetical protein
MNLPVARVVEMDKVVLIVSATGLQRHDMVGVQVFSMEQVLRADRTRPVLVARDTQALRATHPVRFSVPGASLMPGVAEPWVIRGGGAFDLLVSLYRHTP